MRASQKRETFLFVKSRGTSGWTNQGRGVEGLRGENAHFKACRNKISSTGAESRFSSFALFCRTMLVALAFYVCVVL